MKDSNCTMTCAVAGSKSNYKRDVGESGHFFRKFKIMSNPICCPPSNSHSHGSVRLFSLIISLEWLDRATLGAESQPHYWSGEAAVSFGELAF